MERVRVDGEDSQEGYEVGRDADWHGNRMTSGRQIQYP